MSKKVVTGKTETGFQFKIDAEALDDMEMLEILSGVSDEREIQRVPEVLGMLLGESQKKKLYEHCRGKSGRVSASRVIKEVSSIFDAIKNGESEVKN